MVIGNLNVERIAAMPLETDSPLVIDSYTVLPCAVTAEFFESIRRRDTQIVEIDGIVDHSQFAKSHLLNIRW